MPGKRSRAILMLIPLVFLGVLGAWWGLSRPGQQAAVAEATPQPKSAPPQAALPTQSQPATKTADGSRAWVPGTLYRYSLNADQKIAFRKKQASAEAPPEMKFNLQGDWHVGVVSATPERIDARVHLILSSFTIVIDGNEGVAPEAKRAMNAALELPFFISMDRTGLVKLTHFENGADSLVRGLLRALVAGSQFVVAGVPKDTWMTEEHDTTGQFQAEYARLGTDRFEKSKKSYSHLITPQGLTPLESKMRIDVRSKATFELETDLWTRALQSSEHLDVDSGEVLAAIYEHSLSLRLLQRLYDPSLFNSFKERQAALSSAPMSSFGGVKQDPLDQYRQVLGNKNFDMLVKELRSLPKDPQERDDARTRALEQLRALFMLQPAEALKVPGIIRAGMDPLAASPMLGALSAASTKEAIQALTEVSGNEAIPHDIRMDSVAALGMAGEPNRQGVDALRDLSRNPDPMLRDTATLALGNSAFQMGDTDERGAESLVHELNSGYQSAPTPEQQALALRALGNTRSPSMMATIQQALGSPHSQIRQAAIEALRNVPSPDADQLLSQYLLGDPAVEVRRAVIFSCGFRPLRPMLPALAQALRKDAADGVRSDVINLMGAQRGVVPEVMPILVWASQNDPNADLRQMALMYVNTPTTPVDPQASPSTP
ncbi:HEAT repeat domain-containing protein [Archangium sp.]|uniref:HEAT repeat domain-containing protein n=1 Tax=Archangium sp. TaxID=1872627 RepID=UPI002D3F2941|nr:HEAT repeat domain-containing protein [Archangium sp.]HYO59034.1 HEAT repeat domain-containing protein [Archangium sp.]